VSEAGASVASPAGALHRHLPCHRIAERFTAKMSSSSGRVQCLCTLC
jgi:hypothetical protein